MEYTVGQVQKLRELLFEYRLDEFTEYMDDLYSKNNRYLRSTFAREHAENAIKLLDDILQEVHLPFKFADRGNKLLATIKAEQRREEADND